MTIGYADLKSVIQFPQDWDLTYLRRWSLDRGVTFDQVVATLGTALTLFNRSLLTGYYSQYIQTTTDIAMEYDTGGDAGALEEMAEHGKPDPILAKSTGHMIPMKDYGGALGWTYIALRRATMGKLTRDMKRLIERGQNTWDRKLLTRLFTSAYESVGTGKSVPFADGGSADPDYIPPSSGGQSFLYTHNHFGRATDDATGRSSSMVTMAEHMREHGIQPPYELIIPEADVSLWTAQTEFVKPDRGYITKPGTIVRAAVDENTYLGIMELDRSWCYVKPEMRLPQNYAGMFKPAGFQNTNTPLVVRYESGYPLGLSLVGKIDQFPLMDAVAMMTFGVGIANRLAGACTYFAASGGYVDPTIS